jgi:hypothetical protein
MILNMSYIESYLFIVCYKLETIKVRGRAVKHNYLTALPLTLISTNTTGMPQLKIETIISSTNGSSKIFSSCF